MFFFDITITLTCMLTKHMFQFLLLRLEHVPAGQALKASAGECRVSLQVLFERIFVCITASAVIADVWAMNGQ